MTDFVLENTSKRFEDYENKNLLFKIRGYAKFLKQPLKLEMFVPVDEEGNFLEEPEQFKEWIKSDHYFNASESVTHQCRMYKKAKEKVLFEGFVLEKDELINNGILFWVGEFEGKEIIENCIPFNITLTPNAIKQLGL